ncbi:hypothetical protein [Maridesulfovibrio sp.]|uniref:hypothetical protein n=1 Tax=Maridesulfovibrio sp. TaxID=2795000 RepID=UPI002A18B315|nr:hypothetical protein [Maridesulfovibrio sp.]
MKRDLESIVAELNSVSAALKFIEKSIECHESEGREIDACGVSYLVRLVRLRSRRMAESCWNLCGEDNRMTGNALK